MTQQASVFDRLAGIGWNESVPPNGFVNRRAVAEDPYNDNPLGLATPVGEVEIETTPEHRNLIAGDPRCASWTRAYDDPGVAALRERLRERNGIPGFEVVSPDEVERAAALFHRDGFVAVRDAMPPEQLERLRAAAAEVIETLFAADPEGAVGGGAGGLPHRYSFGGTSATRHMFHRPEWCELLDMPTTTPILTAIFGSPNYIVYGCGGDLALPGAIEYQGLHSDNVWSELHDPVGGVHDPRPAGALRAHQLPARRPHAGERADPPDPGDTPFTGADPDAWPTSRSGCASARSARCRPARRSSATPAAGTAARPTSRARCGRCPTSSTSRRGSAARR